MSHLTINDLCKRYSCCKGTIYRWISLDNFPRGLVIGGTVRWPLNQIVEFEQQRTQASKSRAKPLTSARAYHE